MPEFHPLNDQVLVRRLDPPTTQGGLLLPERAQVKSLTAEVLAVGPGRALGDGSRRPVQVSVGDQVVFSKYSGDEVTLDGVECLILREEHLLGVIS